MASSPLNKIERGHQMYREGRYEEALGFYTEALGMAKTKAQKIALHSNRAACYLKLNHFKKAAGECTSVLELDHDHAGALMLRAQTLVTLQEYNSALFDVNRLLELNPSSETYQNLQARLRTQLSLAPIPESEEEFEEQEAENDEPESCFGNKRVQLGRKADAVTLVTERDQKAEPSKATNNTVSASSQTCNEKISPEQERKQKFAETSISMAVPKEQNKEYSDPHSKGWQSIPKPKGHSALDYARWDNVEDDSSEEDDDDDDDEQSRPQYRFRVRTVGVRPVK